MNNFQRLAVLYVNVCLELDSKNELLDAVEERLRTVDTSRPDMNNFVESLLSMVRKGRHENSAD